MNKNTWKRTFVYVYNDAWKTRQKNRMTDLMKAPKVSSRPSEEASILNAL